MRRVEYHVGIQEESECHDMQFCEKLTRLRRKAGLSQEQLADELGVTRQSVSKWESGAAMPELAKVIALSERFGVSVDYLVKDHLEEEVQPVREEQSARLEAKVDTLARDYRRSFGPVFAYTSRVRLLGLPLVSVRFGHDRHPTANNTAVGIVAVGNFSVGVISVGLITAGILPIGMIAFGLLALGLVSVGVVAIGVSAVGVVAAGVSALGYQAAAGVSARAAVAMGQEAAGEHVLLLGDGVSAEQAASFLSTHCPKLWPPLARLLAFFSAQIS